MTVFPASVDSVFTITDALSGTAASSVSIPFSDTELSSLVAIYSAVWLYALRPRVLKQKKIGSVLLQRNSLLTHTVACFTRRSEVQKLAETHVSASFVLTSTSTTLVLLFQKQVRQCGT